MAGDGVSGTLRWFQEQSEGAPEALRSRALHFLQKQEDGPDADLQLAGAAREALAAALAQPGDRAVALDLLAADALVTLALKARAVTDPAGLLDFAARLSRVGTERR